MKVVLIVKGVFKIKELVKIFYIVRFVGIFGNCVLNIYCVLGNIREICWCFIELYFLGMYRNELVNLG